MLKKIGKWALLASIMLGLGACTLGTAANGRYLEKHIRDNFYSVEVYGNLDLPLQIATSFAKFQAATITVKNEGTRFVILRNTITMRTREIESQPELVDTIIEGDETSYYYETGPPVSETRAHGQLYFEIVIPSDARYQSALVATAIIEQGWEGQEGIQ